MANMTKKLKPGPHCPLPKVKEKFITRHLHDLAAAAKPVDFAVKFWTPSVWGVFEAPATNHVFVHEVMPQKVIEGMGLVRLI